MNGLRVTFVDLKTELISVFSYTTRYSSVGIETGYGLEGRGSIPEGARDIFLYSTAFRRTLGPNQIIRDSFPGAYRT
jgi:hypothetical protein